MDKCLHVYYSGSIQGVGFRFTAEEVATSLDIKGWVRNLEDGRVEILVEGTESALKEFLQKIEAMFSSYIRDREVGWEDATGEFDYFDIRF